MGRSQETFNKKEREKKRQKKKKDKAEKREQRKLDSLEGKNKVPTFMYLDEDGNLTETPPDPNKKSTIKAEDIAVSVPKQVKGQEDNFRRTGRIKFFNHEKGYGFIVDLISKENIFVHIDAIQGEIKEQDQVTFDVAKGPKGLIAKEVLIIKK